MTNTSTGAPAASSAVTNISTTTRRRALIAMACLPAAAIVAAPLPSWPATPSIDRTEWDAAFAAYQQAEANCDAAWAHCDAIRNAASAATPDRPRHLFDTLGLKMRMTDREAEALIRFHILNGEQIDLVGTLAEFVAYRDAAQATRARFQLDELEKAAASLGAPLSAARDELMDIPAPDIAALLIKIEITSHFIDDQHGANTLVDARRLLIGEA